MKKIFIVTGEASGDLLASKAISNLNQINSNIEYLSVGGENLKKSMKSSPEYLLPIIATNF